MREWNNVFILNKNKLFKLRDKDLQEKLNEFFGSNLYQKAIDLAISEKCNKTKIIEYYCKYGDYLYNKGEFNQAMGQYLQTIDINSTIKPSYVIRKFLDAQKIKNLTQYLSVLHSKGKPTADHTTLLLNCYTKLKDRTQLTKFINKKEYKFDIDTAIHVCREAGLLDHARSLALSKMYGIEDAVIYLYELLHLFHEIITHYRDKKDNKEIIRTCQQHYNSYKSLWINAFTYFIHQVKDNNINNNTNNNNNNNNINNNNSFDDDIDIDDDDDLDDDDLDIDNNNLDDIKSNNDDNDDRYDLISCIKLCLNLVNMLYMVDMVYSW